MPAAPNERTHVELPLIEQLTVMGWQYLEGDIDIPSFTDRASFREVLLSGRLRDAVRELNPGEDGMLWLDAARVGQAVGALERLGAHSLIEANQAATELLLTGAPVEGDAYGTADVTRPSSSSTSNTRTATISWSSISFESTCRAARPSSPGHRAVRERHSAGGDRV